MKGVSHMENNKIIEVNLRKNDSDRDVLIFKLESGDQIIDLNSEEQAELETFFYNLISEIMRSDFSFQLNTEGYSDQLFIDIATEYIQRLGSEIVSIRGSIPEELKENSASSKAGN